MTPRAATAIARQAAIPEIEITLFGSNRQLFTPTVDVLVRVRDGFQKQVRESFKKGNVIHIPVEFHDNFGDNYCVTASASKYLDVGFYPVRVNREGAVLLDLMMMRKKAEFQFRSWAEALTVARDICTFLGCGVSEGEVETRYEDLRTNRKPALAALLNIATAMSQVQLPRGTPLSYYKRLIWDESLANDRFFGFCDSAIVSQVEAAAGAGVFAPEPGPGIFHPGATRSYKQVQFGEANVQLTFHEHDTARIDGINCVKVEADIDYYRDPMAHALVEVIPNTFGKRLTDPKTVYLLRWIAGRHAGVPEFNPPYTIE